MLEPGQIVEGKYRIVRLIGEGGMGAVYEGENQFIKRRVAIKLLHAHTASPETLRRFEREAQAAGCIGSDHILEVLDLGTMPDGDRFMVMEYLDGEPLSARMTQRRLSPVELAGLTRQVLVGLGAAHQAGIVHRDLKPDNIFVLRQKAGRADFVKIIDFGISKFNALGGDMSMTRTGAVMGTPYYMSPEQAQGEANVDHRSDLYSLGVIMYEAVAGSVPFDGNTFNELMFKIVLSTPKPLSERAPDLDPRMGALIERAMTRDVTQRFQSAEEMIRAIDESFFATQSWRPQPQPAAAAAAPAAATLASPVANVSTSGDKPVPTGNSWAQSQTDIPKQSSGAVFAAIGVAIVMLSAGAYGAYRVLGSKAAPTASATPVVTASPAALPAGDVVPPAPPATASAEPAPEVAPAPPASAAPVNTTTARANAAAPAAGAVKAVRKPGATPSPVAPKSNSGSKTAKSRDFGY